MKTKFTLLLLLLMQVCGVHTLLAHDDDESVAQQLNKRILKKATFSIVPETYTAQIAGGIGIASLGPGWDYGTKKQWSSEILLGYLPQYDTDRPKMTLTYRQTYSPWSIGIYKGLVYHPLRTGVYVNTTFGKQFWFSSPDKYPNGYYSFSTKLRFNAFIGQSFEYRFKSPYSRIEGVQFFYDIHTSDLYFLARVENTYLRGKDYLGLTLGGKLIMRRK